MYVKKLTDEEFVELIIDKELEIANADIRFKDIKKMSSDEQNEFRFYQRYTFKTLEEFDEWKQFFYNHYYDWQPKNVSKSQIERDFQWFNLQWGLKYDFPIDELDKLKGKKYI